MYPAGMPVVKSLSFVLRSSRTPHFNHNFFSQTSAQTGRASAHLRRLNLDLGREELLEDLGDLGLLLAALLQPAQRVDKAQLQQRRLLPAKLVQRGPAAVKLPVGKKRGEAAVLEVSDSTKLKIRRPGTTRRCWRETEAGRPEVCRVTQADKNLCTPCENKSWMDIERMR